MASRKMNTIMYIDDEKPNLVTFRAMFRRSFQVITATSASEATELLNEHDDEIKVIISDQRMQGKTGIEFFESILESHPEPVRVILTGFADQKAMIDSINRARVFRFLSKPWHEYDLRQTIDSAVELYDARNHLLVKQQKVSDDLKNLHNYLFKASDFMLSELTDIHQICYDHTTFVANLDQSNFANSAWKGMMHIELYLSHIIEYHRETKSLVEVESLDLEKAINKSIDVLGRFLDISNLKIRLSNPHHIQLNSKVLSIQMICTSLLTFILENNRNSTQSLKLDIEMLSDDEGAKLMFTDNGLHLDQEIVHEILDLNAETNTIDSNLKLFKDAIKAINAKLNIDSVPNAGTSYVLHLPHINVPNH